MFVVLDLSISDFCDFRVIYLMIKPKIVII